MAELSLGSAMRAALAKKNSAVRITVLRNTKSIETLRSELEHDQMQKWVESTTLDDAEPEPQRELSLAGEKMGEWVFEDNGVYRGQWTNGKAHGLGRREHPDGWTYTGLWLNGKFAGRGVVADLSSGAELYAGDFAEGIKHGFGVESAPDHIYAGTWASDSRGRLGVLKTLDDEGFVFSGSFLHGRQHGFGKEVLGRGGVYLGQFEDGRRNGLGSKVGAVRSRGGRAERYEGGWVNDVRGGHGVMSYDDGAMYRGQWQRNERHGYGVLYGVGGAVKAAGRWEHDQLVVTKPHTATKVKAAVQAALAIAEKTRDCAQIGIQTAVKANEKGEQAEQAARIARALAAQTLAEYELFDRVKDMHPVVHSDESPVAGASVGKEEDSLKKLCARGTSHFEDVEKVEQTQERHRRRRHRNPTGDDSVKLDSDAMDSSSLSKLGPRMKLILAAFMLLILLLWEEMAAVAMTIPVPRLFDDN